MHLGNILYLNVTCCYDVGQHFTWMLPIAKTLLRMQRRPPLVSQFELYAHLFHPVNIIIPPQCFANGILYRCCEGNIAMLLWFRPWKRVCVCVRVSVTLLPCEHDRQLNQWVPITGNLADMFRYNERMEPYWFWRSEVTHVRVAIDIYGLLACNTR